MRTRIRTPLTITLAVVAAAIFVETVAILALNDGHLVYTLDDAYIHLALAENVARGHYGVNLSEASAPSSSIAWPFMLAPLARTPFGEHLPFALGVVAAMLTVVVFHKILRISLPAGSPAADPVVETWLLLLFVLCTNTLGLVFLGMEHSLQLLVVLVVAWGLIVEVETGRARGLLLAGIVLAPLIRYENLAVSAAAIIFLCWRGHVRASLLTLLAVVLLVGGFSAFLAKLGLGLLPTSVLAKSDVADGADVTTALLANVANSLRNPRGVVLDGVLVGLLGYASLATHRGRRILAATTVLAIAAHLAVGEWGWYNRYEIYIWGYSISVLFYLSSRTLRVALRPPRRRLVRTRIVGLTGIAAGLLCTPYLTSLGSLPVASNNIYQQQYQMHRFVVDYYRGPVAVNDLGWVAYRNAEYVLDVCGLANLAALRRGRTEAGSAWMDDLARASQVELAMIYEKSFAGQIPGTWIKLGDLHLGQRCVTPACAYVTFFATNEAAYGRILPELQRFRTTLPRGVEFATAPRVAPEVRRD